jgi:HSP90 family molecular chaperone
MKRLLIKNKVVRVYDSIDELPIVNFQKYNKYILIDSGIGSDVDDIDKHIVKIAKLMKQDTKKAMQELQNMRQNMFMVVNQVSPIIGSLTSK